VYASFVFGIGHFTTNLLEWVNRLDQPLLRKLITGLYYLVPNFSLFNLKDNVTAIQLLLQGSSADYFAMGGQSSILVGSPSAAPYVWPLLYLLSYGSLLLLLALWRYERKEY
jgi:hypothetical protein